MGFRYRALSRLVIFCVVIFIIGMQAQTRKSGWLNETLKSPSTRVLMVVGGLVALLALIMIVMSFFQKDEDRYE